MYEEFYGLQERPFDLTPNPRFLFMTAGHREALSTLQYGISGRKGVTLLVGGAGTGKTTLVHAALEHQKEKRAKAVFLTNPTLTREEFTEFLAFEIGLSEDAARSKTQFLRELTATLLERCAAGIVTALIVDEAQAMPDELLEEVRLLANIETTTDKLFPVVLVGQLELAERLNGRGLQQLKQRVALRSTLAPLNARETASYISERIRIAGGDVRTVFSPEAVAAIYESTGGIPRAISVVCDNSLVNGFAVDERPVGRAIVAEVCRDFDLPLRDSVAEPDDFVERAVALTRFPAAAGPLAAVVSQAAPASEAPPPMMTALVFGPPPEDPEPLQILAEPPEPRAIRPVVVDASAAPAPSRSGDSRGPWSLSGIRSLFVKTVPR